MAEGMRQITLVSFSSDHGPDSLRQALRGLGFEPRQTQGYEWLRGDVARTSRAAILFINKDYYPREAIVSALHRATRPHILGVFSRARPDWDEEILRCCNDVLRWPCEQDELAFRVRRVFDGAPSQKRNFDEVALLEEFVSLKMLGESPAFVETLKLIKKFARHDAPVLIEGETGTGKELGARAIHYLSARRDHPFIAVNCGTIPDNLLENELFGHEKGAFTDARESQPGLVEQAHRGTLFLDEVDTLSTKAQVALLRFIEDRRYRRLGSKEFREVDVRVIAATNADIQELVEAGVFRTDLLFRLNVLAVKLPPLRERGDDVTLLAQAFVRQYSARYSRSCKRVHPDTLAWMRLFDWPGNVRELENLIHREFLLAEGHVLSIVNPAKKSHRQDRRKNFHDRRRAVSFDMGFKQAKASLIEDFEKRYLRWLMSETGGNITLAAKRAQKDRSALSKLLQKHGVRPEPYRLGR